VSLSLAISAHAELRAALGREHEIDDADLMLAAADAIVTMRAEIERLQAEVARLDKLSDDLHASKIAAIVEQTKSRDRALVAERKVKALRIALNALTDPEDAGP